MQACDRAGQFRAIITDYGLTESKDGAVGISVKATLTEWFDLTSDNDDGTRGSWLPWESYQMEAEGVLWIVGKNEKGNKINELQVTALINHAGWDGNIASISGKTWQPTKCQIAIEEETYKGETRRRISFVNDYDRNPLGMGTVSSAKAAELQNRFGSQLRALAGNAKRNGTPANGNEMPAPPPPARQTVPAGASGDQIPF